MRQISASQCFLLETVEHFRVHLRFSVELTNCISLALGLVPA